MGKKRHSVEQVVRKLREAEVELAKGARVKEVCRKLAITEHTYYRMECLAIDVGWPGKQDDKPLGACAVCCW